MKGVWEGSEVISGKGRVLEADFRRTFFWAPLSGTWYFPLGIQIVNSSTASRARKFNLSGRDCSFFILAVTCVPRGAEKKRRQSLLGQRREKWDQRAVSSPHQPTPWTKWLASIHADTCLILVIGCCESGYGLDTLKDF